MITIIITLSDHDPIWFKFTVHFRMMPCTRLRLPFSFSWINNIRILERYLHTCTGNRFITGSVSQTIYVFLSTSSQLCLGFFAEIEFRNLDKMKSEAGEGNTQPYDILVFMYFVLSFDWLIDWLIDWPIIYSFVNYLQFTDQLFVDVVIDIYWCITSFIVFFLAIYLYQYTIILTRVCFFKFT